MFHIERQEQGPAKFAGLSIPGRVTRASSLPQGRNSPSRYGLSKVLISRILGVILADFKFGSASVVAVNRAGDDGPVGG